MDQKPLDRRSRILEELGLFLCLIGLHRWLFSEYPILVDENIDGKLSFTSKTDLHRKEGPKDYHRVCDRCYYSEEKNTYR